MKEIANGYTIALLSVIAVLALAAFSTPAMAGTNCTCDVSTHGTNPAGGLCSFGTNGTVNGTMYVDDGEGELGLDYVHVDFEAIPAGVNITWARVYWHVWMPGDWTKATFCNETKCSEKNITICDPSGQCNCTQNETEGFYGGGCGTTWVYWNVTNNVTSGEQHNITIDNRAQGADGRTFWVILVAVLENSTKYTETHYWVNQGYEDSYPDDSSNKTTTWFNGTIFNESNSTLWHLALCSDVTVGGLWFNDHHVRNDIPRAMAKEEIDKSWIEADSTTHSMMWDNGDDDWFHPVMAILMDNITYGKDLIVEDIEFPTVMRPNKNHTINATIKNQGNVNASRFNVTLYANDVKNSTKQAVSSLNASESTTVSFTNVNLSEGCYTFKVVADSGGVIDEINENNNATSKKYQVGYVVVVKSDSDFADLVNDTELPTDSVTYVSGTYYIQNLTITNCAGDGIYIVDTSKNFVINNCTIQNCKDSGVFFHNLTNGTVNGSIMQNNTKYGIEVGLVPLSAEDPKSVNITNNNITKNKLNGIDLVGFNCTVKDNNVTDNSVYGIYLLANDSNITNNNITDNTDYGLKQFNSTGNYVYENNFTDNKASNPGHQAWANWNNHWNTTAKGNWWSDWKYNSGYFDSPRVYKIDGGSNKDYKPEGPPEENYTYDFSTGAGNNKWAFKYQVYKTPMPPNTNGVPSEGFSKTPTDEYSLIATDNGEFKNNTASSDNYAAHRFNFSISEDQGNIIKINVTWNGIGTRPNNFHGAKLYIWNFTSGGYSDPLDSNSDANEVNLTGEKTGTCCSDYIDSSSNMTVMVVQNRYSGKQDSQKSTIKTDYVRVIITT